MRSKAGGLKTSDELVMECGVCGRDGEEELIGKLWMKKQGLKKSSSSAKWQKNKVSPKP